MSPVKPNSQSLLRSEDQHQTRLSRSKSPAKILVIDSGVGGLSICKHLLACENELSLLYFSDNHAFPYGEKSEAFIIERLNMVVDNFIQQCHLDLIVIACNTASTIALPSLRKNHSGIPFVGVVPAIKTAATQTLSNSFALLATPGTVSRRYTQELVNDYAAERDVIMVGSTELVQIVEDFLLTGQLCENKLQQVIDLVKARARDKTIDTVVLGCTHFPLVQKELSELQPAWQWIESGPAIASRVDEVLRLRLQEQEKNNQDGHRDPPNTRKSQSNEHQFWTSSLSEEPNYQQSDYFLETITKLGFAPKISLLEGLT